MASDINLAHPNTDIVVKIGTTPFESSLSVVNPSAEITSVTGFLLDVTIPQTSPSVVSVPSGVESVSVSVDSPPESNTIEVSSVEIPSAFVLAQDIPEITVLDSQSLIFNLVDLDDIVGQPDDGDIIVFDGDTNTFIFDSNAGQGGSLSADVEVTNLDGALGDAIGMTYQEGASIQGIVRDILEPTKPFVADYDLNMSSASGDSSSFVVSGNNFIINSVDLFFEREEALVPGTRIEAYYNDVLVAQSPVITENQGQRISVSSSGSLSWASDSNKDFVELKVFYDSDGLFFSKKLPIYRVNPITMVPTNYSNESILGVGAAALTLFYSSEGVVHSGGHSLYYKYSDLKGSVHSESPDNSIVLFIPSDYTLDSIVEMTGGFGTADMTNSFSLVSEDPITVHPAIPGLDEYSVYLYRSNQNGALKSNSSLRVKVL